MKSWMIEASKKIIQTRQEAHVISYYKHLNKLQAQLKESCERSTHTKELSL